MSWLIPALSATMITSIVSSLLYYYLYKSDREQFLLYWSLSWAIYSLRFVCLIVITVFPDESWMIIPQQAASGISAYLLIHGTGVFLKKRNSIFWPVLVALTLIWTVAGYIFSFSFFLQQAPVDFTLGMIYLRTGYVILQSRELAGAGQKLSGWTMILWGVHKADYAFLRPVKWFAPWGFIIASVLFITAVIGILLVYFEKIRNSLNSEIEQRKKNQFEKERVQAQLYQAQKMEAIGTLAGGLAHDFNNVLGGIIGSLDLIRLLISREELKDRDKLTKYMDAVMTASERGASIVKQLLTLSMKHEAVLVPVDINSAIRNVQFICENSFPKSVKLDFKFTGNPCFVTGDPTQIEQVLLNLCLNASHAMTIMRSPGDAQTGTLTLSAEVFKIDTYFKKYFRHVSDKDLYLKIQVADTGVGMDDDTQKKVFEPFFTTKNKRDGTGLGMSVVYNIITGFGGFIDIYSKTGTGTIVSLYLPLLSDESVQNVPEHSGELTCGSGKIMVIDDDPIILDIAKDVLTAAGYTVISADNGTDGVEIFIKNINSIDCVLLDMSMPGMSGLEVYEKLSEVKPELPVLITSGFAMDEKVQKACSLGAGGFIQKPYTAADLSRRISELLKPESAY